MFDYYQYVGFFILGGASIWTIVRAHWNNRNNERWESSLGWADNLMDALPAPLPPEIRDELDQTPRWWDREFHKLLEASDAQCEVVEDDEIIEKSANGSICVVYKPTYKYFHECTCGDCRNHSYGPIMPF